MQVAEEHARPEASKQMTHMSGKRERRSLELHFDHIEDTQNCMSSCIIEDTQDPPGDTQRS